MRNENKVYFASSVNYVEFCIESRKDLYITRFWKNGDVEYAHNCLRIEQLPRTPLALKLFDTVQSLRAEVSRYLNCKDTLEGSQLFWKIKDALEA